MLEHRSIEPEILEDRRCDEALAATGYRFMAAFNRRMGGIRVVRQFIAAKAAILPNGQTLRVLDLGSGSCDVPLAVSGWALTEDVKVEFTCLEISDVAVRLARQNIERAGPAGRAVRVVQADVFTWQPDQTFDCAIGSLFFHHFTDAEILALVARLRGYVKKTLLVNDLLRYTPIYLGTWLLTLPLPRPLRHDVLVSIRRGFKLTELRHLLNSLGRVNVTVRRDRIFRALAIVEFRDED